MICVFSGTAVVAQGRGAGVRERCGHEPVGYFRQVTGASVDASPEFYNTFWRNKESDLKDDRWTLNPIEEVDPAYKFLILRPADESADGKCHNVPYTGKLISPTGKVFDFKQATYDYASGTLRIATVERDDVRYEAELRFYAGSIQVGREFHAGNVRLRVLGKIIGKVSWKFPFASAGQE